jgi:serine phosphatase RsbU (regulator of sigma subunit)
MKQREMEIEEIKIKYYGKTINKKKFFILFAFYIILNTSGLIYFTFYPLTPSSFGGISLPSFLYTYNTLIWLGAILYTVMEGQFFWNKFTKRQLEIIENLKSELQEKNKDITDSINYAKRLQDAILPPLKEVRENLPESFILYKPKDIVAGDFYWAEKTDHFYFIAAADCTGHGVPGAMVSMVCSNVLNRTVSEFGIVETGKILDNVRELVLDTFKKSGEQIMDGMDISLCRVDKKNSEIQWSGANNPLWYFIDNELIEIKADKQPIGKYADAQPFTSHSLKLPSGTNIYMFTDGYADQFSPADKKMTKKKFKEVVISSQNKTMNEQNKILSDFFESWKGNSEQVDDVCVIGIRI